MMKRQFFYIFFCAITVTGFSQSLSVVNLRCEYKQDPVGVDLIQPNLSWELRSNQKNILQMAWRIIVADDPALLQKNSGNMWDSKKTISASSIQVQYKGKPLQSAKKYFWKVMVWDNKGNVSVWSNQAHWQMGLLAKEDWKGAKWIGYDEIIDSLRIVPHVHLNGKRSWGPRRNVLPLMRKEFSINKKIRSATTFICGLGQFEMYLNGKKIGDHFLDPGWTNYSKHALYVTFDITNELQQGKNAVGVMLGNGFYYIPGQRYRKMTGAYGHPKMIMRTVIEYADGSTENIISDQGWRTFSSPVIFSSIFGGEDYDATKEQDSWNKPELILKDGEDWFDVIITEGPQKLESQMADPVKVMEKFAVQKTANLKEGVTVYDLGQNFSGIPSITVRGNKGDTVRIFPAELVNADGSANQRGSGGPSFYTYILKGGREESWQPRFSYYGFRYLEVRCIAGDSLRARPQVQHIEGWHIRNAAAGAGSFACSNQLFNKTNTLIDWAIKSNMVSLFTDCPHREKLGWLEQTYLMGSSVHYGYDIALLNRKMILDMIQAQHADGKVPEIAPEFTSFTAPFDESPEWGSASIILPWYNYKWYGDIETLRESYDMMKRYAAYLESKAKDNILSHGLGDWYDLGPNRPGLSQMTKAGITATATYYYDLTILVQAARLLNKPADVKLFEEKAAKVKASFNVHFFDKQKLQYDSASQTANAMALFVGLVESKHKQAVINALVKDIRQRNNALTAGDIGYRYVLKALDDAGRSDVIFGMNNRDDVPGYGYQLKQGATALTESWQALPGVSNNHFMLGHLMEWFYSGLAGIKQSERSAGFKEIEIKPQLAGDVTNVKAVHHSVYGDIVSEWKKNGNNFELNVQIPANTTARVYIPLGKNQLVTENGRKITAARSNNSAVVMIGSGNYSFKVK